MSVNDGFVFVEGNDKVSDFYICDHQVTQREYLEVMGQNPSAFEGDLNRPVEYVTWYDAIEYCKNLSEMEGLEQCYSGVDEDTKCNLKANGYRLPTETEWEYAARGGKKSNGYKFSGSDNIDEVAWYNGNGKKTHPVKKKKPNELGIYDMSGNVWEWCWDWHGDDYPNDKKDYAGPESGTQRVYRGGSSGAICDSKLCAVDYRNCRQPSFRNLVLGFRIVRTAK